MSISTSKLRRFVSAVGLTALVFGPAASPALAAPGTISQIPLYVGPNVEPNVVFLNDDSGSMEFSVMTPEDSGYLWLRSQQYLYTHPLRVSGSGNAAWRGQTYGYSNSGNLSTYTGQARVVPTLEALEYCFTTLNEAERGVWRAWNHDYNKLYYNPEIRYEPWIGVDKDGAAYGKVNPEAAPVNPYDPAAGSENLTENRAYKTQYPKKRNTDDSACPDSSHGTITIGSAGTKFAAFYPARYYKWKDTDEDGEVDADDDKKLIEIKPDAFYPRSAERTDCATEPGVCTYDEEIQNFANWFSYYRNRDLTAKNAATSAIADVTGIRVGYATINNNTGARFRVASMNADSTGGNKKNLFNKIYGAGPGSGVGTPLRTALHQTGLYYECKSGNIMNASGTTCPILPKAQGGMCQKNYTILMSDGFWSDSSDPGISAANADGDGNSSWDGSPYGDSHKYTLADVAMHYYERDLSTTLSNDVPSASGAKDNAPHQHMTTFTVAFGVSGTLDPETDDPTAAGFSWPDPDSGEAEKIDDLWHAAYNGRGEFFNARHPGDLKAGLTAAFASVARGKSSSASVAFNTTRLDTDSMLYQASFNPSDNWAGALVATALAIDGQLESTVWNAAARLDERHPSQRLILTHDGSKGIPFRTLSDLSAAQQQDLNTDADGNIDSLGQARLDYLRGDRSNEGPGTTYEFRERSTALGDIVYSNPVFVGRPQSGYEDDPSFGATEYSHFLSSNIDRPSVIYVGANDGMLHGFWANDGTGYSAGDEAIAYMPNLLFSGAKGEGLHYLTEPGYEHRYYVDLSPTIADAYVSGAWRTILIGGFRAGGRGLFALDVTQPQNFNESAADDIVLWEFTHTDMGHSFSKPTIALLENDKWAAIFGNGYNDSGSGEAQLFILYLEQGMDGSWTAGDYEVITTGVGSTANRNGLSTPALADTNGDGKADRVYAGDLFGNLWVFDLTGSNTSKWAIAYKSGSTPTPLFMATAGGVAQPITSKPIMARNPAVTTASNNQPNILVYFGTGQYMVSGDKSSVATQTFYGVWDKGTGKLDRTKLVQQTQTGISGGIRTTSDNAVNFSNQFGWYLDLPAVGERVVVDPKIRGAYVFFNTLIPDAGSCNSKGRGFLNALKLASGGSPDSPVFDINNDGVVDDNDLQGGNNPSGVELENIPAGSNFLDDMMYTPDDEGNIDIRRIDAGIDIDSGRLSWREVKR